MQIRHITSVAQFQSGGILWDLLLSMGAKDVFTNPQFVTSSPLASARGQVGLGLRSIMAKTSGSDVNHIHTIETVNSIEEEWHQKYAFIIGLLRKPHALLIKESLTRERDKLTQKLNAYQLERNLVRESINKLIKNG